MTLHSFKAWIDVVSAVTTLIGGMIAALWVYSKYIVERGLIPPTQFSVSCTVLGRQQNMNVLEIIVRLKNCGASTLIVGNLRVDMRTLDLEDKPELFNEPNKSGFGRLKFPKSIRSEISKTYIDDQRGILLLKYDTFVQAGVEQLYSFATTVSPNTTYVLVWASFQYAQHPSTFQKLILWLSRRLGLVQWSLAHIRWPHTTERVFPMVKGLATEAAESVSHD